MDPDSVHQIVNPASGVAGKVAARDDCDQRGPGAFATLEQPFRK